MCGKQSSIMRDIIILMMFYPTVGWSTSSCKSPQLLNVTDFLVLEGDSVAGTPDVLCRAIAPVSVNGPAYDVHVMHKYCSLSSSFTYS